MNRPSFHHGLAVLAVAATLAACSALPPKNPLATWVPSRNFDERRPVLIVLHATTEPSLQRALDILRSENAGGRVSAHYLIAKDGRILQLVAERERAWHAGAGSWGAITDLNSASLGIELDNDGEAAYPDAQIASLLRLLDDLCTRWRIPRTQVIAHADLAPTRKVDPGPRFPWQRVFEAGFGRWPSGAMIEPPPGFDGWLAMAAFGYPLADRAAALRAFRIRFRGRDDGDAVIAEFEPEDLRILYALTHR